MGKEEIGEEAFEKRLNVMLQTVAFVMRKKWNLLLMVPGNTHPRIWHLCLSILMIWMHHPLAPALAPASSSSSSSSAPGTTLGPKAGTNQEEEEHDSCDEFANPSWLHEYSMAQCRKTRSNASILLPHMQ